MHVGLSCHSKGMSHSAWACNLGRCKLAPMYAICITAELMADFKFVAQVPNGMSWDLKKKVMYYNDTPYQTCTAYATDDDGVPIK